MKLYNTMTQQKEEFTPLEAGSVKMYVCGPTVYNFFHVGNARPMIIFDALRCYLEYRGYDVTYVQNLTDIEDRIINRSIEDGISCDEITNRYIKEFWTDARGLGVKDATVNPKATETVDEIVNMISKLIEKEMAYQSPQPGALGGYDVYYRIGSFPDYGKLSHQPMEDLMAGARVETSEAKENVMDFVLWKGAKPGEPAWDSPWGPGRPGWHIECSAMIAKHLGETIDIHCGGQDLIFPHHENEIAQSEGCHGKPFARYWLHNGFISIDNTKMSKSLGNFFTVREAAGSYGYENIRMFMLMSHYRSPLNYSTDVLEQSKSALERIKTTYNNLQFLSENGSGKLRDSEKAFIETFSGYRERFCAALDDDFNTADAIAVIFELVREINIHAAAADPSKTFASESLSLLSELCGVLNLLYCNDDSQADSLTAEVEALIEARTQARAAKDWAKADEIRGKLGEMGIILEDTPQGVKWRKA